MWDAGIAVLLPTAGATGAEIATHVRLAQGTVQVGGWLQYPPT